MSTQEQPDEIISEKISTLVGISHDTGDLVLLLKKDRDAKQVDAEFRVHRALISLHSSVLRDLVESANPNEYIDGCPIIPCYGDSPDDFRALLTALYNGMYVPILLEDGIPILTFMIQCHFSGEIGFRCRVGHPAIK